MTERNDITVAQQLVIRKPAAEVFRAFADPEVTTKFWFNRSSGPLASGARVTWYFDVHGVSAEVRVRGLEPGERIVFEWGDFDSGNTSTVELTFEARPEGRTYVSIVNTGFTGDADAVLAKALDAMGGFSLVLAAAKAWLEHGVDLQVVADKG